jgi:hypothetical protein
MTLEDDFMQIVFAPWTGVVACSTCRPHGSA